MESNEKKLKEYPKELIDKLMSLENTLKDFGSHFPDDQEAYIQEVGRRILTQINLTNVGDIQALCLASSFALHRMRQALGLMPVETHG